VGDRRRGVRRDRALGARDPVIALTGGTLLWAVTEDQSFVGEPGASESYEGWLTALAVLAVAAAWAAYGLGVAVWRRMLPRVRRPRA
jgi:hypothetical protein